MLKVVLSLNMAISVVFRAMYTVDLGWGWGTGAIETGLQHSFYAGLLKVVRRPHNIVSVVVMAKSRVEMGWDRRPDTVEAGRSLFTMDCYIWSRMMS